MKRIIFVSEDYENSLAGNIFYRGRNLGWMMSYLANHFNIEPGYKYQITIVEGTQYRFVDNGKKSYGVRIVGNVAVDLASVYLSFVCRKHFEKVFFVPDLDKTYDITVKKVK